jgi:hypothetical protein
MRKKGVKRGRTPKQRRNKKSWGGLRKGAKAKNAIKNHTKREAQKGTKRGAKNPI